MLSCLSAQQGDVCITEMGRGNVSGGAWPLPESQGQPQPVSPEEIHLPFLAFLVEEKHLFLKHSANFLPLSTVQRYMFLIVT